MYFLQEYHNNPQYKMDFLIFIMDFQSIIKNIEWFKNTKDVIGEEATKLYLIYPLSMNSFINGSASSFA